MAFAGISYVSVLAAAVASWMLGAVWYTLLSRQWLEAQGRTCVAGPDGKPGDGMGRSPLPFVVSFVTQLVMAWVLAGMIGHIFGKELITARNGALSGAFAWLGFVAMPMITAWAYKSKSLQLVLIDGGYWLATLVLQGAVIGALFKA